MLPRVAYRSSSTEFDELLKGKYELVEKIGKGSYGDVYRALDVRTQRYVAIKRTRHHSDGGLRCVLEPVVMRSLHHPSLLYAEDVLVGATLGCVVMPLALDDVGHYLQRHPKTTLAQRLAWCWQICQALACLHQAGVVHGDVKEANCLVMPDHRCVLADFTLSVLCPQGYQHSHMVYTFTHRPPELFLHKPWSFSADAWALGCTLYEIIYQTTLFPYQSEGKAVDDERPLYTKALACFRQFGTDTGQPVLSLQTALLGKRPGKWFPAVLTMHDGIEYVGINDLILRLLRLAPSERLTLPEVLAHSVWGGAYPLYGYWCTQPTPRAEPWGEAFAVLPPPAEPWVPHLQGWAETWMQHPPPEQASSWVWASLCVLMKMMHLSLYCSPPALLKEVQKTERSVLEASGWSIPWKKWSGGVPDGTCVRAASPRAQSPLPLSSPTLPERSTLLMESAQEPM